LPDDQAAAEGLEVWSVGLPPMSKKTPQHKALSAFSMR
jgi:hypothetical protein